MQYTIVGDEDGTANLTVFVEGQRPLTAHSTHPNYDAILKGVIANDETVYDLFDVALSAATKFERLTERITVAHGRLYLDSDEVHSALAEQVIRFLKEGVEDWKPLVNFFENVQANPNVHSREQLYGWLTAQDLTITPDGLLVGYKGVRLRGNGKETVAKYESQSSGRAIVNGEVFEGFIPNPIGGIVEMPRDNVLHAPSQDCASGLHVGTHRFAQNFGTNAVLEVHVNPRDVVSVPFGDVEKMRCCRYKIIKVIDKAYATPVKPPEVKTETKTTKAAKGEVRPVKVGDVYASTDPRRASTFKVTSFEDFDATTGSNTTAVGKSMPLNITRKIKVERLQSRKYKLVKKGR